MLTLCLVDESGQAALTSLKCDGGLTKRHHSFLNSPEKQQVVDIRPSLRMLKIKIIIINAVEYFTLVYPTNTASTSDQQQP